MFVDLRAVTDTEKSNYKDYLVVKIVSIGKSSMIMDMVGISKNY